MLICSPLCGIGGLNLFEPLANAESSLWRNQRMVGFRVDALHISFGTFHTGFHRA